MMSKGSPERQHAGNLGGDAGSYPAGGGSTPPPATTVDLGTLKLNPRNPRTISKDAFAKLCESIRRDPEFMALRPIIVDEADSVILGGNQRYRACVALGMREVPAAWVRFGKFTPAQRKRFIVVDNAPDGMAGEFDFDILSADFDLPELVELGFTEEMLGVAPLPPSSDAPPQIDRAEELRKQWGVETGDLWHLGEHKLVCGDCTDAAVVARVMGGEKAQAVLTDPVYGQNQDGVPNDSPKEMAHIVPVSCKLLPCSGGVAVMFQSPRTFTTALDAMRGCGWSFNRCLWMYKQAQCVKPWRGWLLKSEAILVFSKGEPRWNECKPYSHDCYMMAELSGELYSGIGWHGSVKPLKVVTDICQRICKPGDIVYEPFCGSGTTIVACERLGRKCRAIEISPGYVAVTLQRMADAFPGIKIERHP